MVVTISRRVCLVLILCHLPLTRTNADDGGFVVPPDSTVPGIVTDGPAPPPASSFEAAVPPVEFSAAEESRGVSLQQPAAEVPAASESLRDESPARMQMQEFRAPSASQLTPQRSPLSSPGADPRLERDATAHPGTRPRQATIERHEPNLASELLQELTRGPAESDEAQSLALRDAVERLANPADRRSVVRLYWQFFQAHAEALWAAEEADFLERLTPAGGSDAYVLEAARAQAVAERLRRRQLAGEAAWDLADRVGTSPGPWYPSDAPLASTYRTRLQEMYAPGAAPRAYLRIDQELPALYATLQAQATAVAARQQQLDAWEAELRSGQVTLAQVIAALRELTEQRKAFLQSATDYNIKIADYAIGVAGSFVSRDGLVAMLIGKERLPADSARSDVVPAAASAPVLEQTPRGFAVP